MNMSKKPNLVRSIFGLAILSAVILYILFSGSSAINDENIKQHLDRFAAYVADKSNEGLGKTGKFTYGDISVKGFGFNKTAEVSNVILELSEKTPIDNQKWSFSTARIEVLPDPVTPGRLYFVFPEAINLIENSQLKTTVTASTPIKYAFTEGRKNGSPALTHALFLPNQIVFTPGQAVGDANPHPNRTVINLGDNAKLVEENAPEQGTRSADIALSSVQILNDSGSETSIGSVTANYSENTVGEQVKGQYSWTVNDIVGPSLEAKNGKPLSTSGNVSFKGEKLGIKLESLAPEFGNTDFTINKLDFGTDDFKLMLQGWIGFANDDPLPFGSLDLSVDNAGKFIASFLVPDMAKHTLTAAFQKVSTQPVGDDTHVNLPLKRDKNGVLYIGDTTFEALTAALAADALKLPPKVLPPDAQAPSNTLVLPPPDNPALGPDKPAADTAPVTAPASATVPVSPASSAAPAVPVAPASALTPALPGTPAASSAFPVPAAPSAPASGTGLALPSESAASPLPNPAPSDKQ